MSRFSLSRAAIEDVCLALTAVAKPPSRCWKTARTLKREIKTVILRIGMFYFASALAPDDPEPTRRAMIGAIVFGATTLATSMLGQNVLMDRFQGSLKLIVTMPVSKTAYACGILSFRAVLSRSAWRLGCGSCAGGVGFIARVCQNQDLQDWRDLQDFVFAKTNIDKRPPIKYEPVKS